MGKGGREVSVSPHRLLSPVALKGSKRVEIVLMQQSLAYDLRLVHARGDGQGLKIPALVKLYQGRNDAWPVPQSVMHKGRLIGSDDAIVRLLPSLIGVLPLDYPLKFT